MSVRYLLPIFVTTFALTGCGGIGENPPDNRNDRDGEESAPAAVGGYKTQPAQVYIDGSSSEWKSLSSRHSEMGHGNGAVGLDQLWVAHNERHLFLQLAVASSINLEQENNLTLYLDTDNDPTTGIPALGLGAEVKWNFGQRLGELGDRSELEHEDVGLASLPTVREDTFEIAFRRSGLSDLGLGVNAGDSLRIGLASDADRLPDADGGLGYVLTDSDVVVDAPGLTRPPETDLRLTSYNVPNNFDRARNRLFEEDYHPSYRRILQAVIPPHSAGCETRRTRFAGDVQQYCERG